MNLCAACHSGCSCGRRLSPRAATGIFEQCEECGEMHPCLDCKLPRPDDQAEIDRTKSVLEKMIARDMNGNESEHKIVAELIECLLEENGQPELMIASIDELVSRAQQYRTILENFVKKQNKKNPAS